MAPRENVCVINYELRIPKDADRYEAFSGMVDEREREGV